MACLTTDFLRPSARLGSAILVAALALSACSTNKGGYKTEEAVEARIMGMTKEEVLIDLGPPDERVDLGNGKESHRYKSAVGGLTGGECTLSIVFQGEKPTRATLSANDRSWVSFPLGSCTKILQTLR